MPADTVTRITVRVTPRAGRDEVVGFRDNVLLVKLKAPPADGAANQALEALLAGKLSLPKTSVFVARGHTSRLKVVGIEGLDHEQATSRLSG